MNNMQWAIENNPQLFSGFDCQQCVNRTNPAGCDMTDDEFDETVCAKGHVEWLMKPHESGLEAAQTGDGEKDECEPAETESGPQNGADSRERLEADAVAYCDHFLCTCPRPPTKCPCSSLTCYPGEIVGPEKKARTAGRLTSSIPERRRAT